MGKEFGGNLLNQKGKGINQSSYYFGRILKLFLEIDDLFKDSRRQARNASQIQGLLSRRIDCRCRADCSGL